MNANGVGAAASAIGNVRPQAHLQFRLREVRVSEAVAATAPALAAWNERIDAWRAA